MKSTGNFKCPPEQEYFLVLRICAVSQPRGELQKAVYLGTILHACHLAILFPLLTVLHGNRSCVSPVFIICVTSPPFSFPIGNESCPQQSKSQSTGEGAELSELSLSGQNVEETVRIQEETQDFSRSFVPTGKWQNTQVCQHILMGKKEKNTFMACERQRCHLWSKNLWNAHLWRL